MSRSGRSFIILNKQDNVKLKRIKGRQYQFRGAPEVPAPRFELRNQGLQHKKKDNGEIHEEEEPFQKPNKPLAGIVRTVAKNQPLKHDLIQKN